MQHRRQAACAHARQRPYRTAMDIAAPFSPLVRARNLRLTVPAASGPVNILNSVDLDLQRGESVGVVGSVGLREDQSADGAGGAGAGDWRHHRTCRPRSHGMLDENALARVRRDHIGIVFQSFHLIPDDDRAGERGAAAGTRWHGMRQPRARRPACARSGWGIASPTCRANFPAASSSAWPSPAPSSPESGTAAGRRADRQSGCRDRSGGDGLAVRHAGAEKYHAAADHPRPSAGRALRPARCPCATG